MPCQGRKNKKLFQTQREAEQEARKAKHRGWNLYAYACGDHWHLASIKKPKQPT